MISFQIKLPEVHVKKLDSEESLETHATILRHAYPSRIFEVRDSSIISRSIPTPSPRGSTESVDVATVVEKGKWVAWSSNAPVDFHYFGVKPIYGKDDITESDFTASMIPDSLYKELKLLHLVPSVATRTLPAEEALGGAE